MGSYGLDLSGHNREQWRVLVNTIVNLRVAERLAASQEELGSVELVRKLIS
jgi:hypothetical protein